MTHERAFAAAEKAFGTWAKVEVPAAAAGQVPPATRRVIVVDRPGAVQTEIRVGHIGVPRQAQGLPGAGPRAEDPRRRRRQPAVPRAADQSGA